MRARDLRRRYGLTPEQYAAANDNQGGVCAICRRPCARRSRLSVDHDHSTGVVRGLLCDSCNLGIGKFDDDPDLLKSAMEYLTMHKARNAIALLGGTWLEPSAIVGATSRFTTTRLRAFSHYLKESGVQHFPGREVAMHEPTNSIHLPPCDKWPWAVVLGLIGDQMREACGEPLLWRGWYREAAFNAARGGVSGSRHQKAQAGDFDFKSREAKALGLGALRALWEENGAYLQMGVIDYDSVSVHVDVMDRKGGYWEEKKTGRVERTGQG